MSVDLVRIVDSIHRDKNISKDILFEGIQSALTTAARKHYPDAGDIEVRIDPESGAIEATKDGSRMDPAELGRIAAQTAKQVIIQKIREAERDSLFDEFEDQRGDLMTGTVQRFEGGAVIVNLGKTDAILPRSEQIPGESYHPNERIRAIILDVRKVGQRVKIILSRTHPDFVRRLFELEIPEIADQIIAIRALAREAGYRSKVAVTSIDTKVDAVGACVGVRGTRIKNIVDELGGERIDIVRWNESLQVLIPNALQPAEIDEVMLCHLLGRAIVLVRDDQLSLAIGRRGQNVRLASKLVGWDIEIMTAEELDEVIEKAVKAFERIDGVGHRAGRAARRAGDPELRRPVGDGNRRSGEHDRGFDRRTSDRDRGPGRDPGRGADRGAPPPQGGPGPGRGGRRRRPARPRPDSTARTAGRSPTARPSTRTASSSTRPTARSSRPGQDGEDALLEEVADAAAEETDSASPTEPSARPRASHHGRRDGCGGRRGGRRRDPRPGPGGRDVRPLDPRPRGDVPAQRRRSGRDDPDRDRGRRGRRSRRPGSRSPDEPEATDRPAASSPRSKRSPEPPEDQTGDAP